MEPDKTLHIWVGHDGREAVASDVAAHSIRRRTQSKVSINYLKHRELRQQGLFARPWLVDGSTGNFIDLIDGKPFSTEFSHTRFLVPALQKFKGWALFFDADMIFLSDIEKLFAIRDDKYAVMCVKHQHIPTSAVKMDGREQLRYRRKNWSSFMLWNCAHPSNTRLTPEIVSFMKGSSLHAFSWLDDHMIGDLPYNYNYISGVSPKIQHGQMPAVIHYTEGGPWFDECKDVPYAGTWLEEYEDWQANHGEVCGVPSVAFEKEERNRK